MRLIGRTALAGAVALTLSSRGARADTELPAVVPIPDDSSQPGEGTTEPVRTVASFRLPDSIFRDLGCTLAEASAYPSGRDFGLALADVPQDASPQPSGWTGVIAVQPRWPPPLPPDDSLRGVRNWDSPYAKKFLRGVVIVTGTEIASGVVLALLPREFSKWDDTAYQRGSANLKRAWTEPPVWDGDSFFNNYMGHPYAGAFYYNMLRSQGGTVWQSVGYTVFQSTLWEYVVEAVAEQPSVQDLIVTPVAGSLLGELFHHLSLQILRKGNLNLGQKALVFFLNPSWVINNGFRAPE